MSIKLLTLNIEGSKHLDLVIPFIKKEKPEVVCLQEVFEIDFPRIKKELEIGGQFFPTTNKDNPKYTDQPNGYEGIAFFTNLEHTSIKSHCYSGKGYIQSFKDAESREYTLVYSIVNKDGKDYTIGTTHFTWTPDGKQTKQQLDDLKKLINFIDRFNSLILCGDFNAPRGGETFSNFTKHLKDNLPKNITSTIDIKIHNKVKKDMAVDNIFSKGAYNVSNVKVIDGVRDHKAIIGEIE